MYAGEIVERGLVQDLFARPEHPYTVGLIGSIPRLSGKRTRLSTIAGTVPSLTGAFVGCRFASRCPFVEDRCRLEAPPIAAAGPGHTARCRRVPLAGLAR